MKIPKARKNKKKIDENRIEQKKSIELSDEFIKDYEMVYTSIESNNVPRGRKAGHKVKSDYYYRMSLKNVDGQKRKIDRWNNATSYLILGELSEMNGDVESAMNYYDKALHENTDSEPLSSVILNSKGIAEIKMGDFQKAIESFKDSLSFAKKSKSNKYISTILSNIGTAYKAIGNFSEANQYFTMSIEYAKDIDDVYVARLLNNIGEILIAYGDIERAKKQYQESIQLLENAETYDEIIAKAISLRTLAKIYKYQDNLNESEKLYQESLTLLRDSHIAQLNRVLMDILIDLSVVFARSGKASDAEQLLFDAREFVRKNYSTEFELKIDSAIAEVLKLNGNSAESLKVWEKIKDSSDKNGITELSIRSRLMLAIDKINTLNLEEADKILWEVIALSRTLGIPVILVEAMIAQANVLALEGKFNEALKVLDESKQYLDNIGKDLHNKVRAEEAKIKALIDAKKGYEIAEIKEKYEPNLELGDIIDYISEIDAVVRINM